MKKEDLVVRNFVFHAEEGYLGLLMMDDERIELLIDTLARNGFEGKELNKLRMVQQMGREEDEKYNIVECVCAHCLMSVKSALEEGDESEFHSKEEYEFAKKFVPLLLEDRASDDFVERIASHFNIDMDDFFEEYDPDEVWGEWDKAQ